MSMLSGQQFKQLPMFATPTEIHATHVMGDARFHGSTSESLQQRKLAESHAPLRATGGVSLYDSIKHNGIQSPLEVLHGYEGGTQPTLVEGHHRLYSALQTRPHDLVPLMHEDARRFQPKPHHDEIALGG